MVPPKEFYLPEEKKINNAKRVTAAQTNWFAIGVLSLLWLMLVASLLQ